jgi:hypothetical protein
MMSSFKQTPSIARLGTDVTIRVSPSPMVTRPSQASEAPESDTIPSAASKL